MTILAAFINLLTSTLPPESILSPEIKVIIFYICCTVLFLCFIFLLILQIENIKKWAYASILVLIASVSIYQYYSTKFPKEPIIPEPVVINDGTKITESQLTGLLKDIRVGSERWESIQYLFQPEARYVQQKDGENFFDRENEYYRIKQLTNPDNKEIIIGVNYFVNKIYWEGESISMITITNKKY